MSWCADCGYPNDWGPSFVIAVAVAIGVAFGYIVQRVSNRLRQLSAGTAITLAVCVTLAAKYWLETHSIYAALPFVGVIIGVLHRKPEFVSVFSKRRV